MTESFCLLKPTLEFSNSINSYTKEFNNPINGIAGTSMLTSFESIEEWITSLKLYESKNTVPVKNHVPGFQYILVRKKDSKIIGMSNLRTELNDYLLNYGGHIGYSICPSERKKGYGKIILRKTLIKAKELGLERVLVTCNDKNIGSEKIILSNNGIFENKIFDVDDRAWVKRHWIQNK